MKRFRVVLGFLLVLTFAGGWLAFDYYQRIYAPNVVMSQSSAVFYLHSNWDYERVCDELQNQGFVQDINGFRWVAERKNYPESVKSGRFVLLDGMSNNALVNLLRSGEQQAINLSIPSVRSLDRLISIVSENLEADSADLAQKLADHDFCALYGFTPGTIFMLFIPNTYQFYWNTSAEEFVKRMAREYKRFWTEERVEKARRMGFTQSEVATLASIVQSEQGAHPDERPVVAGLYLNRLRKGMKLESDPTLVFALQNFHVKRVLKADREIDSPYNTYKYTGLPPGPIMLPETTSMDAVLNATSHNYIFMCAKEDFSGYHHFTSSYEEHMRNAARYQRELNKRKIYR